MNATKVEKPIARALAWASEDRFPASLSATSKPIAGSLPRRISILTRSLVGETVEDMDSSYCHAALTCPAYRVRCGGDPVRNGADRSAWLR